MVHELLGIRNGRVDMSQVPDIRPELSVCYYMIWHVECRALTRNHTGNHIDHINGSVLPGTPPGDLR